MASSSKNDKQLDEDSPNVPDVAKLVIKLKQQVWDPFSSPDWDKETHTKEAVIRIKRYFCNK